MKDNGGAAFPEAGFTYPNREVQCPVSGMTMRQYYKAAALMGILQCNTERPSHFTAKLAGEYADVMIAEDREAEATP